MSELKKLLEEKGLSEEDAINLIEASVKKDDDVEEVQEELEIIEEKEPDSKKEEDIKTLIQEEVQRQLKINMVETNKTKRAPAVAGQVSDTPAVVEPKLEKEKFGIYV